MSAESQLSVYTFTGLGATGNYFDLESKMLKS
jgi:hypothetical protein